MLSLHRFLCSQHRYGNSGEGLLENLQIQHSLEKTYNNVDNVQIMQGHEGVITRISHDERSRNADFILWLTSSAAASQQPYLTPVYPFTLIDTYPLLQNFNTKLNL